MYELTRHGVFGQHAFQQLQVDVYFLFQVCFGGSPNPTEQQNITGDFSLDFLPVTADETTPVYCGLFNEIISSAQSRYFWAED